MIWVWVAIAVVLDGIVGMAGAALPDSWLRRYRAPVLGFATGALLASSFADVLPEAIARGGWRMLGWAVLAVAALGAIEIVVGSRRRSMSVVALLTADALHNIGDGMAIAAAFVVSPALGIVTSAAVIIHEVPEEVADYAVLRMRGVPRLRSLVALAAVQLTAALGAAGTLLASTLIDRSTGVVFALAGGTFVYIGGFDLFPEVTRHRSRSAAYAFALAIAVVLALG